MAVAGRRVCVTGLILALLFSFVGFAGVPAYADPTPLPVPSLSGWDTPPDDEPERTYDYPSLVFFRDELRWDSPKLEPEYLDSIKTHKTYKGQVGSEGHLLSAWKDYARKIRLADWEELTNEQKRAAWEQYLDTYIRALDNGARGRAAEPYYAEEFKLKEAGYRLNARFPGIGSARRGDAFTVTEGGVLIEIKSGSSEIDRAQARFLAAQAIRLGKTLDYVFLAEPLKKDLRFLDQLNAELAPTTKANKARIAAGKEIEPLVMHHRWPAAANPVRHPNAPPPPASGGAEPGPKGPKSPTGSPAGGAGSLAAQGQHLADSAAASAVANSPSSLKVAAALQELAQELANEPGYADAAEADMLDEQLGGVDFSTLELRYVSDTYDGGVGTGVQYAYQVDAKPGAQVSFGGRQSAQLAADSFFTWLVLPPRSFTVNLNPDEPNRIIDAQLGKTDAGRVLLEADLQMKKTVAKLIHPDTARGADVLGCAAGREQVHIDAAVDRAAAGGGPGERQRAVHPRRAARGQDGDRVLQGRRRRRRRRMFRAGDR